MQVAEKGGTDMQDAVLGLTVIIPSYNPDERLVKTVEGLKNRGFRDIIVVNDGSDQEHQKPFVQVEGSCTVIHHKSNRGRGMALKTAFSFCIDNRRKSLGMITVDGDNTYLPDDVYACGKALLENCETLVWGSRNLQDMTLTFSSRCDNIFHKMVLRLCCGLKITDTQSGLQATGMKNLEILMKIHGAGSEFAKNILYQTRKTGLRVRQIPVQIVSDHVVEFFPMSNSALREAK